MGPKTIGEFILVYTLAGALSLKEPSGLAGSLWSINSLVLRQILLLKLVPSVTFPYS